jgi:hypothetical protein
MKIKEDDSENESKHVAQKLTSYDKCIIVKYIVALDCTFLLIIIIIIIMLKKRGG